MKNHFLTACMLLFAIVAESCKDQPSSTQATRPGEELPNVVFVYVDDLGFGDLGSYGQSILQTPNLDRLASEGIRFTQHYAGSTVCAPSRAALLTGKHTGHTSVRGNSPEGQLLLDDEETLADIFKKKGYVTGTIGKWGVGNDPGPLDPQRTGFDHAYGYVNMWHAHNFYPEFLYRNGQKEVLEGNETDWSYGYDPNMREGTGVAKTKKTYVLDKFQEDALNFIENNKDNPFFLYYCLNMPHANNEAGYFTGDGMEVPSYGSFTDKDWPNPEKGFAQMITLIDDAVGELELKLAESGLAQNTILVFVSDNGPHNEGGHSADFFNSNGRFRGYKRDLYEGGIRVPLIIKWPGHILPGSVAKNPVTTWDFLPTFAEILDYEAPADIDGVSFLPTLLGNPSEQKEHGYLYWEFYELGGRQAIRVGDYKLVKLNVRTADKPVEMELYDLSTDPAEAHNLILDLPEKAKELEAILARAHVEHKLLSLFSEDSATETRF